MEKENKKPEFWETAFGEKQEMWGFEPSKSAVLTKDFFVEKSIKNILILGLVMDGMRRLLPKME
ncbi:hypothetical protein [Pedobacter sp. UC225_65]|uniref:hypothetical protein n=1 Tax=Pedobacter sp. UC225_65 TaxID=3350173 RepID=UPI003670D24D